MGQFDNYNTALKLSRNVRGKGPLRQAIIAAGLLVDLEDPWSGYYRHAQEKGGPFEALGVWRENGELVVVWGSDIVWRGDEARIKKFWPGALWSLVPFEWYQDKLNGKEWPDVHQIVLDDEPLDALEEVVGRLPDNEVVAGPGHNSGATIDEVQALADEITKAEFGVKTYATIISDEQRDRSQTLRSTLLKLASDADKRREVLKRPFLSTIREIDGKWMPLVRAAKAAADAIRTAQEAWGTLKLRRQREEEQKIEAERQRLEQEAATRAAEAQAAVDRGQTPPEPVFQPPPPPPPRVAPQTSFKGGSGRAAHQRVVNVIEDVVDWSAFFLYFIDDPEVRSDLLRRGNLILKNTGEIPPGCKVNVAAKVA